MRLIVFLLALTSCGTLVENPGEFRSKHPVVLGVPGALIFPNKNVGIGLSVQLPSKENLKIRSGASGSSASSVNADAPDTAEYRTIHQSEWMSNLYLALYPSDKSSFFIGPSASISYGRFGYNELANPPLGAKQDGTHVANVEWDETTISAGLPFGVSACTVDKTCTILAFGPKVLVSRNRSFVDEGTSSSVDIEARSKTLASFDQSRQGLKYLYVLTYGFSIK